MTQKIQLKRSATQGSVPTTSDLDLGEVAINTYDGKVFLKKNVNGSESIVDITNPAVAFSSVSGKPTTLSGYGITDSVELTSNKGVANGYAPLDSSAKIATEFLPSYVDDVLEYANLASFPGTGETSKIYVTLDTNKTYRWSGSAYVEISAGASTFSSLTGRPTTLSGYGITDALSSSANSSFTLQYGSLTSGTWSNVGYNLQTVDATPVTGNSTGAMIKYTIHAILTDAAHPDMRMREAAEVVLLYFPSTSNAAANGTISGVVELNEYGILTTGLSDLNTLNAGAGVTSTQMLTFGARFNGSDIELLVFLPSYPSGYLPANGAVTINFVKTII